MKMVKLDVYSEVEWPAVIVGVEEKPLRECLFNAEVFMSKMRKPDSKTADDWTEEEFEGYKLARMNAVVLNVTYKIGELERTEWLTIPRTPKGYNLSNLRKVQVKNPKLPSDTADWPGESILVSLDSKGEYYELSK